MGKEFKNDHIEKGEQFLGLKVDHSGDPTPFVVVRVSKDVTLRSRGVGDVIVDLENFLKVGMSPKGKLRFVPLTEPSDLTGSSMDSKVLNTHE